MASIPIIMDRNYSDVSFLDSLKNFENSFYIFKFYNNYISRSSILDKISLYVNAIARIYCFLKRIFACKLF